MKTYFKTFARMFKRHLTRLVSIILMVLVSVGFTAGIGMSTEKIDYSLDDYYNAANVSDLILKSTSESGFSAADIDLLKERYGEENVLAATSLEAKEGDDVPFEGLGEGITRIYYFAEEGPDAIGINRFAAGEEYDVSVSAEDGEFVAYAERDTLQLSGFDGGRVSFRYSAGFIDLSYDFVVAGTVVCPLHFAKMDDVSIQYEDEELSHVIYLFNCPILSMAMPKNDVYIRLPVGHGRIFSHSYNEFVDAEKAALEGLFEDAAVLTLRENYSFASFHEYGEKIDAIGYVIMVVFLLVTLLVVLSTMTRLLEEERGQIACMQTLGYSPFAIVSKYLLFALVGTLIGGAGALFAGEGLSYIIYLNFDWCYALPAYSMKPAPIFFLFSAAVILLSTLLATFAAGMHKTREVPAVLLRPRTPKAGKKVLLERVPLLWNRLSFKYKSTLRNVLRFKMRFLMTVVAVMASTGLVVAGLAVLDCCLFQEVGTAAMIGVSVIVLVFAALLNAVVIYTLTNINISERNRELATLMVLGYQTHEVDLYIYREIYITGAIGIALGLPFGCLLCLFIFGLLEFGSVGAISWFVWIAAALLSLLFVFIVTLMLKPKINKIDMNESLKAIE